jgi:hypothetical protein
MSEVLEDGKGHVFYPLRDDIYFRLIAYRGSITRQYFIKRACNGCGKDVFQWRANNRKHSRSKSPNRSFCSSECFSSTLSGPGNHKFSGGEKGKRGLSKGHILAYAPNHPNARKNYVAKHRLVVEEKIGRYLREDELVHHIDCDPTNNDIKNLVVVTKSQHNHAHWSILDCIGPLLQSGHIIFNHVTLSYEVIPR